MAEHDFQPYTVVGGPRHGLPSLYDRCTICSMFDVPGIEKGSCGGTPLREKSPQTFPVIAMKGCWCGEPGFHSWPGKEQGAPHPRNEGGEIK